MVRGFTDSDFAQKHIIALVSSIKLDLIVNVEV